MTNGPRSLSEAVVPEPSTSVAFSWLIRDARDDAHHLLWRGPCQRQLDLEVTGRQGGGSRVLPVTAANCLHRPERRCFSGARSVSGQLCGVRLRVATGPVEA